MMEAELALKDLKKQVDRVIIVGFSMGGLIAMYLAMRYKIEKLVLLSAAVKYISAGQILEEVRVAAGDAVKGRLAQNPLFHLYEYKLLNTPISSAFEFLRVVKMVEPYYDKLTLQSALSKARKMASCHLRRQSIYIIKSVPLKRKSAIPKTGSI